MIYRDKALALLVKMVSRDLLEICTETSFRMNVDACTAYVVRSVLVQSTALFPGPIPRPRPPRKPKPPRKKGKKTKGGKR